MKLPLMTFFLPLLAAASSSGDASDLTVADESPFVLAELSQPSYCSNKWTDWQCYKNGKPKCCSKTKGNCPNHEPSCECTGDCHDTTGRGSSICVRAPDYDCYKKDGRPSCCSKDSSKCPPEMTICDKYDSNYCGAKPDYDCYRDGVPSCCMYNELDCPMNKPKCGKSDESFFEMMMMKAFSAKGGADVNNLRG